MPKISVIIPVYNVEKYLRECLDSVVNQTLKEIEIICVDDGSTDGSPAILAEYAAKDPCIKVLTREIIAGGATTILVSHSLGQIHQLCNKVLWLHKGEQVVFSDNVPAICDCYSEFLKTGGMPCCSSVKGCVCNDTQQVV